MKQIFKLIKEWVPGIIIALILTFFIRTYVVEATIVPTGSMIPTIEINDRIMVEKITDADELKRGDIVVFYPPIQEEIPYVKRLIGIGGDVIEVKGGYLYRNGEKLVEPYIEDPMTYRFGPVKVPEGKFLFLGDNRNHSYDSHLWPKQFVDSEDIIGKALFRFYPFSKIGLLK